MEDQPRKTDLEGKPLKRGSERPRWNPLVFVLLLLALVAAFFLFNPGASSHSPISWSFYMEQLEKRNIAEIQNEGLDIRGKFKTTDGNLPEELASTKDADDKPLKTSFITTLPPVPPDDLDKFERDHTHVLRPKQPTDGTMMMMLVYVGITLLLFVGLWLMFRRARDQLMGGGILSNFSKSPAKKFELGKKPVNFKDVAGLEGVKSDLEEIVEFLKSPKKFQRLGGRVPKGVLLMGPPGTGKTLLARAVAGEAGVPFFSISGSEFIQMFVGVGASRVRDMFKTARENSPCILFIDEIDAVGRHRGAGMGGGHDEREQTLNQILSEMDGFSPTDSVIVLAATNRPDVLDPALLRPGRFDRHITVDRPTQKARKAIFQVHTRDVPLADDVDLDRLASGTVGLTGADIQNLANEATLWATRQGKDKVTMDDFEQARDKILMGPKREEVLSGKEKEMTAYHEAGHALLAWVLPVGDRLHKVTIVPRGRALGVTQLLPEEDQLNIGEQRLHSRLTFVMGGRAAEKLVFNEYSAGAENDLVQATKLARRMVSRWGMSERLGPIAFHTHEDNPFLGRDFAEQREFSDHTAQVIDEEVARILHDAGDRARQLLAEHRDKLDALAHALLEKEELDDAEITELLGPSAGDRAKRNGQPAGSAEKDDKKTAGAKDGQKADAEAKDGQSAASAQRDEEPAETSSRSES